MNLFGDSTPGILRLIRLGISMGISYGGSREEVRLQWHLPFSPIHMDDSTTGFHDSYGFYG